MNWKAVSLTLLLLGAAAGITGWIWADQIHDDRHSCRLGHVFGTGSGDCPSKLPAIVLGFGGLAVALLGVVLLIGAASSQDR